MAAANIGRRRDFEVTIKLRNNHLKSRRVELGLGVLTLCQRVGISYHSYATLEGLKTPPVHVCGKKAGSWRDAALKLADFFGCPPEELFPEAVCHIKKNTIVATFDLDQLPQAAVAQASALLPSPEDEYITAEIRQNVSAALSTLSPQEERVLRRRYGLTPNGADGEERSLTDVACELGLSRERIRQIEGKALKKLGHPHGTARKLLHDEVPPRRIAWEKRLGHVRSANRLTMAADDRERDAREHDEIARRENLPLHLREKHRLCAVVERTRAVNLRQLASEECAKAQKIAGAWGFSNDAWAPPGTSRNESETGEAHE